jgi:membrane protease YdiL (CAAX protease family)
MSDSRAVGRSMWQFYVLTYGITLLTWGSMIILRMPGGSTDPSAPPPAPLALLLLVLGGFAPSIAGVVVTWRVQGTSGLRDLWQRLTRFALGWRAYLVIVLLPLLLVALRAALHLFGGGGLARTALLADPLTLAAFCTQIALFGPISEEFGWRGFALDGLLARWRPRGASLVLGILWAFWHLPLFFIPGTAQAGYGSPLLEFPVFALMLIGSAVVYTWLYLGTGHSLWSAILFHFTFNFCVSFWATLANDGWTGRWVSAVVFLAAAVIFSSPRLTSANAIKAAP